MIKRYDKIFTLFILSSLFISCASVKEQGRKNSNFSIVVNQDEFFTGHVYFLNFYDGEEEVSSLVKWGSNSPEKVLFRYFGGKEAMLCLQKGSLVVTAEYQGQKIKKKIKISKAKKDEDFEICFEENSDFSLGRVVYLKSLYKGEEVQNKCRWSSVTPDGKGFSVKLSAFDGKILLYCTGPGTEYIIAGYNDEFVFRTIFINPQKDNFYIKCPTEKIKKNERVNFSAFYDGADVTNDCDWSICFSIKDELRPVAQYNKVKGEAFIKNTGGFDVIACYNGEKVFLACNAEE